MRTCQLAQVDPRVQPLHLHPLDASVQGEEVEDWAGRVGSIRRGRQNYKELVDPRKKVAQ